MLYTSDFQKSDTKNFLHIVIGFLFADGWKQLDTYGEFYKLMAAGHHLRLAKSIYFLFFFVHEVRNSSILK